MIRTSLAIAAVVAVPVIMRPAALPEAAAAARPLGMKGPVADSDALYTACGRVFADPQAFGPSPAQLPGMSPYAKGNVPCRATTFISYDEAVRGLTYLESRFPDFVELYKLDEDFSEVLDRTRGDGLSAGLPSTTGDRIKSPLYLLRITDEKSAVPEQKKAHFAVALSIHGIERAGIEGGLRAAEDLATWGANSPDQKIMETNDSSLPAGEVLKKSSVYFILPNPDGWRRGDLSTAGPFFSRYNGNGVDLNRDWPAQGYTFKPYTAWSEPESRTYGKVLKAIKPKWQGGLDLHGQLTANAFSYTLLRSSQRPYDKNQRMLQYVTGAWRDAETRLSWSTLIKPNDTAASDPRLYGVQWGTVWDTIDYTNTGSISNWFDSELGLGADAISNEMSLSHLSNCGTGNCYLPEVEQLHVDGNKSLIYGLVNFTLLPEDTTFRFTGRAAWLDHGRRKTSAGNARPLGPSKLPMQESQTYSLTKALNQRAIFEFDINGPSAGVYNGGVSVQADYTNVQGVGVGDSMTLYLDRFAPDDPKAQLDPDGWETVQSDFTGGTYVAAGSQVDVISPIPGKYRLRVEGAPPSTVKGAISFTKDIGYQDPGQRPYSASNMDFFTDLQPHLERPDQLTKVAMSDALPAASLLAFDSVMASDKVFADAKTPAQRAALGKLLRTYVQSGGNLVLTDDSLRALEWIGVVPPDSVSVGDVYAGFASFNRLDEESGETVTTYDDPLAANVAQPGAAEGSNNRHQLTDPGPIGYAILGENGGDLSTQPEWTVAPDAWATAGGRVVGRVIDDVAIGELVLGEGRIRIIGSLIPMPSTEQHIPHGVDDYAVTYTGFELTKNVLSHRNPGRVGAIPAAPAPAPAPAPRPAPGPAPLPATGGGLPWQVAVAVLTVCAAFGVRRSRLSS